MLNIINSNQDIKFRGTEDVQGGRSNKRIIKRRVNGRISSDRFEKSIHNELENYPQKKGIFTKAKEFIINLLSVSTDTKPVSGLKTEQNVKDKSVIEGGIPQPEFVTDYETRIAGLKQGEDIDTEWVKNNTDLIKEVANFDVENADTPKLIRNINKNKENFINEVETSYADKKSAYIDSIRKEYIDIDPKEEKDKALQGLDALIKYGTKEDLRGLSLSYKVSRDDDIMQRYAKLARKVGDPDDSISISAKLDPDDNYYNDTTKKELMKTAKKLMVDDAPFGFHKNEEYAEYLQYRYYYENSQDPEMVSMAKSILNRLAEENPTYMAHID